MQIINRGQVNILVFTLTEEVTLTSPCFLFELKCIGNEKTYYFIASNTSSYTYRYDKFFVEETTLALQDLANGKINLPFAGQYDYRIFEQTSSTNLNPVNTTKCVEIGIIKVVDTNETTNINSYNPSFNQYNPAV